jgi:hypothetical protein
MNYVDNDKTCSSLEQVFKTLGREREPGGGGLH